MRPALPSLLLTILFLLASFPAHARINVVTLPARDSVQLTIYNSVDLTLVKETRVLTFRQGINKLEFSWANTLIDPTSVEFKALTHADAVDVLDVSFPPRVSNTLEWRIQSGFAGEVTVEIRYFTSGIKWSADYVAEAVRDEKAMTLAGNVRVTNNSGEDYENTQVRLVVGTVRLIEEIAKLAREADRNGGRDRNAPMSEVLSRNVVVGARFRGLAGAVTDEFEMLKDKEKKIVKEALSEYFLYTVEGRDTIPSGWAKRLPSFRAADVPVTSYYKFEKERWGDQVIRFFRFTNSEPSQLGKEPLPDGDVKAFRLITDDKLYAFVGRTAVKYIPVNEFVELELGPDREVSVKPTLVNWTKTSLSFDANGNINGWTTTESWEIDVQNSREIDVMLDIRSHFSGDWSLITAANYEKVDVAKVKFILPLKSRAQQKITYELTVKHGVNSTR